MPVSFAGESSEYRDARNVLLEQEIALRREMEAVARSRRALPPGPAVDDYVFDTIGADGEATTIKLSQLFRAGTDALVIYHYMFPRHRADAREAAASGETAHLPRPEQPCPSCTALIDQLNAAALHYEAAGGNFAVVAKAPIESMRAVARDRDWKHVRLLSSAKSTFKRDFHAEDDEGDQLPLTTVFTRESDGTIRLFWASELTFAPSDPGQDHRAQGTIEPFWNMFDLTPKGRPDFAEQLEYHCCSPEKACR